MGALAARPKPASRRSRLRLDTTSSRSGRRSTRSSVLLAMTGLRSAPSTPIQPNITLNSRSLLLRTRTA
eukprot:1886989-Pyramimonas_sp.AAC.1